MVATLQKVIKASSEVEEALLRFARNCIEARKAESKARKHRRENEELSKRLISLFTKKNMVIQVKNFLFQLEIGGRTSVPYKQLYEEMLESMPAKDKEKWIKRCNQLTTAPQKKSITFVEIETH